MEDCETSECRFFLLLKRGNRRLVLDREKEGDDAADWPSAELLDRLICMLGQALRWAFTEFSVGRSGRRVSREFRCSVAQRVH
jgi:glutathione peroxidase-family protein